MKNTAYNNCLFMHAQAKTKCMKLYLSLRCVDVRKEISFVYVGWYTGIDVAGVVVAKQVNLQKVIKKRKQISRSEEKKNKFV